MAYPGGPPRTLLRMSLALVAPAAPMSSVPALAVLARIADEVDPDGIPATALAELLHARWFRSSPRTFGAESPGPGRRGADFCGRLAGGLGTGATRFSYRIAAGVPSFVVTSSPPATAAASCFLHLHPGTAPEV